MRNRKISQSQKEFIENDVQTENKRGNLVVFLTIITLPMQAETQLIKLPRLPLVSQGPLQTISTILQKKG